MADLIAMLSAAAGVAGGINPRGHFNTVLYTGNGGNLSVTGVGFQPDFNWIKCRSNGSTNHLLEDVLRGAKNSLISNGTGAELSRGISSFDSDGFSFNDNGAGDGNVSGNTYVAWNWKANGAGSSNTDGTITSTVSANTTGGISIMTWSGTDVNGTIGHGLGVAPGLVIVKNRNDVGRWRVWHKTFNGDQFLYLDGTEAVGTQATLWNSTVPSATVISAGTSGDINWSGRTYVGYCFAEVEGFSKFGSYTGNGSATGPSVTTDFQPTWLMIKRTDTTGDWILLDSARDATNPRDKYLVLNTFDAEATGNDVDFNSTGFQLKSTSASVNASGGTYIYACFA
jgi:hypothetical protein